MAYFPELKNVIEEYREITVNHRGRGEKQRKLIVVIPDRNEDPKNAANTLGHVIETNLLASKEGIKGKVVDEVMLSEQSNEEIAKKTKELSRNKAQYMRSKFGKENVMGLFPKISYFRIHDGMKHLTQRNKGELQELSPLHKILSEKDELYGKGTNMFLSTLYLSSKNWFDNPAILYIDADDRARSGLQTLAMGITLSHMNYDSVTGRFRRYHKNDKGDKMERGGRVNASIGKPLFDMLNEKSLMKEIGYPLSGDQGALLNILKEMRWPLLYGIETSWRIQFHSHVNGFNKNFPLLLNKKSVQVDIGGSDDQPIGEGKPIKQIEEGIKNMSQQVGEAFVATTGYPNLESRWRSPKEFMDDFYEMQWRSIRDWRKMSKEDYGEVLPISAGISEDRIRDISYASMETVISRLYERRIEEENRLREDFLCTLKDVRNAKFARSLEDFEFNL